MLALSFGAVLELVFVGSLPGSICAEIRETYGSADTSRGRRRRWSLLDQELAPDSLAAILGLGRARLQKAARGELDKRYAELGGGLRYAKKMSAVDRFLLELHGSVAETLPTESPCGT